MLMPSPIRSCTPLLKVSHLTREGAGTVTEQAALLGLDACLGVPGLPQSGTGQTTILTGHNAPAALGEHYGPYPNKPLRQMLAEDSIFKTLLAAGQSAAYANAYPTRFIDRLNRGKGRLSANTQAAYLSGLKIRSGKDLQQGRAISALFSNKHWPEPDLKLPRVDSRQPIANTQQAADIAGVAVGIPAAGIGDHQAFLEVAFTVQQAEDDQPVEFSSHHQSQ